MINLTINDELKKIIDNVLSKNFTKLKDVNYLIEKTKSIKLGDYSTNIAFVGSKVLKQNPIELANKIVDKIKSPLISKVEIAGPGFINIFLSTKYYDNLLKNINSEKSNYGQFSKKNKIYNVEYVSANPTGSLHIGHARNAALGSSLANIFEKYGIQVDREYYINDGGNQINKLGLSVLIRYLNLFNKNIELPEDAYHGEEPIWVANYLKKEYKDKFVNTKYDDTKILDDKHRAIINNFSKIFLMDLIKKTLSKFNCKFDIFSPESDVYKNNIVVPTLNKLKKYLYVKDDALWLKTTLLNDDKDRVLIKSDNMLTYFTPDIAYHTIKLGRKKYDKAFVLVGADHASYQTRMKAAVTMLGYKDTLEYIIMQMVKLLKDGKEFKMSKRSGQSLTLNDLIETIGIDCSRWFLLSQSSNNHVEIDVDLVTKKDNNNSFYYVQYAHARICQILLQSKINLENQAINTSLLTSEKERELLTQLTLYPKLIENIAQNYEIHKLINYLYNLASLFHSYYSETKILGKDDISIQRLILVSSIKNIISSGFSILEIKPLERI